MDIGIGESAGVLALAAVIIKALVDIVVSRRKGEAEVDVAALGTEERALKLAVEVLQKSVDDCQKQHATAQEKIDGLWQRIRFLERALTSAGVRIFQLEEALRTSKIVVPPAPPVAGADAHGVALADILARQSAGE